MRKTLRPPTHRKPHLGRQTNPHRPHQQTHPRIPRRMGIILQPQRPPMDLATLPRNHQSMHMGQKLSPNQTQRKRPIRMGTTTRQRRTQNKKPQTHDTRLDVNTSNKTNRNTRSQTTTIQQMGTRPTRLPTRRRNNRPIPRKRRHGIRVKRTQTLLIYCNHRTTQSAQVVPSLHRAGRNPRKRGRSLMPKPIPKTDLGTRHENERSTNPQGRNKHKSYSRDTKQR